MNEGRSSSVLCQFCGSPNPEGRESCARCGNKLMVVSGIPDEAEEMTEEAILDAQEELEEHLLERITTVEDSVRQLSAAVGMAAEHIAQLEHNMTVAYAGVQALASLLESQGIVSRAEVMNGWERSVGQELLSRDLSRKFKERSQRILSLAIHAGDATTDFRKRLRALELALVGPQTELAQQLMTQLVRMAPGNDELWGFIGEAAFETGDLASARIAFSRVIELRGPHYETLIYLGTVNSDLRHFDEAEHCLLAAREMSPEAFLPEFALGAMAALRGDHAAAVTYLEAAVEREAAPEALHLLGVAHLNLNHSGRAIDALRQAIDLAPNYEDALYQLGFAYLRRGWTRLALDTFQQVLRLDPQRLQYQETVRLLSLGEPHDLPPSVAKLVSRAEDALEHGRPDDALDLFTAAAKAAPDESNLHATSALLASALGRTREAVGHAHWLLRNSSEDSPYLAAAVVALLESLRHAGRTQSARRLARRLYSEGNDPLARSMAAYELSLVESEVGDDLGHARQLARESLEIAPKELRHYPLAALGAIALKRGRFREATQYLEQATEIAPRPLLLRQLAVARLGAGDSSGAEAALEAANEEDSGGLDEELLGHVRHVGSLVQQLTRRRNLRNGRRSRG